MTILNPAVFPVLMLASALLSATQAGVKATNDSPPRAWRIEAQFSRGNDDPDEPSRETALIKFRVIIHEETDGSWLIDAQWVALSTSPSPQFPRGTQYVFCWRRAAEGTN